MRLLRVIDKGLSITRIMIFYLSVSDLNGAYLKACWEMTALATFFNKLLENL